MKIKIKQLIRIVLGLAIMLGAIAWYSNYEDAQRAEYAATHGCTWIIQGSHDVCK